MEKKAKAKVQQPAVNRSSCGTRGGSVLSDMSKLAVPFGLIAAKNSLEKFIANRDKEMKKTKAKPKPKPPSKPNPKAKPASKPKSSKPKKSKA